MQIKAGDTVQLKPGVVHACPEGRDNHRTAKVQNLLGNAYPGGFRTDRDLRGCRYWNVEDVIKVPA